jgi:predicted O-methyltransferase YrrM
MIEKELVSLIENAGSDHLPTFGGIFEGGYHIQQNPAEFAQLLSALKSKAPASYLQIGSAAGGSERLVCEYVGIESLTIIDDAQHAKFHVWTEVNRPALEAQGVAVRQHIGNSHAAAAREFLALRAQSFDLVGIDGDHTLAGVRLDWELVQPYLRPGTLVWFHDISDSLLPPRQRGSAEIWKSVSKYHDVLFETYEHCGTGLLAIVSAGRVSNEARCRVWG